MGQRLWAVVPADYLDRSRDAARADFADAEHTPVHEYAFKLARLKDTLFTPSARRLAEGRHAFMVEFFQRLEREVAGEW